MDSAASVDVTDARWRTFRISCRAGRTISIRADPECRHGPLAPVVRYRVSGFLRMSPLTSSCILLIADDGLFSIQPLQELLHRCESRVENRFGVSQIILNEFLLDRTVRRHLGIRY